MKSFNTVYNKSKEQTIAAKKAIIEKQRVSVIDALKEQYMITCDVKDMPKDKLMEFAKILTKYWTPKDGLTSSGVRLLNEKLITLTPSSTTRDVKTYIESQTKKNLVAITEAYMTRNSQEVIATFKEDIEPKIQKKLNESFVNDVVWNLISNRIKLGM